MKNVNSRLFLVTNWRSCNDIIIIIFLNITKFISPICIIMLYYDNNDKNTSKRGSKLEFYDLSEIYIKFKFCHQS